MILLFLGSWRSTLIIPISIPLSILLSLAALSALGETINVMTLGGLALAVGILVDDAHRHHREHQLRISSRASSSSTRSSTARSRSSCRPSSRLLCICIVFVPMFQLGGVAGYLFRPLAEAVVFALLGVVPAVAHAGADDGQLSCCASRARHGRSARGTAAALANPLERFQRRFERRLRARARRAIARCCGWRLRYRASVHRRLPRLCSVAVVRPLRRSSARTSSRRSMPARSDCTSARPTGTRIEETARAVRSRRADDPRDHPAATSSTASSTTSACRSAASTWPTATSGTIGTGGRATS